MNKRRAGGIIKIEKNRFGNLKMHIKVHCRRSPPYRSKGVGAGGSCRLKKVKTGHGGPPHYSFTPSPLLQPPTKYKKKKSEEKGRLRKKTTKKRKK